MASTGGTTSSTHKMVEKWRHCLMAILAAAAATAAATVRMLIYEELKGGHTDSTQLPFPVKMM